MKRLTQFGWYLVALLYAVPALAVDGPTPPVDAKPITLSNLVNIAETLVDVFISVAALIMMGGIVYTGLQMILARGDQAAFAKAKQQLWYVIIGSAVILGVGLIMNTIANFAKDPTRAITGSSGIRAVQQQGTSNIVVPQDDSRFGTPF